MTKLATPKKSSDFARRKSIDLPFPINKGLLITGAVVATVATVLLFFVKPYYIFGPIILIPFIFAILKYPVLGLYTYMFLTYIRPQDLFRPLVILRPNIAILALTIIGIIIHRKLENRTYLKFFVNDKMFFAFMAAAVLSNVTSIWFSSSMETTGELLKVTFFYIMSLALLENYERIYRYLKYYCYSVAFVSAVQIWTYLTVGLTRTTGHGGYGLIVGGSTILGGTGPIKMSSEGVNGVGGFSSYFYANASELGLGMCIAFPISYYMFKVAGNRLIKAIMLLITLMFIVSIFFSGSRGAFLAFAVTLIYLLYKEKKLLIGLVFIAILAGPVMYIAGERYTERIQSIGQYETDESVGVRLRLWRAAVNMVLDYPIFGLGTGNFSIAYGSFYRAEGSRSLYWSPHNIFIQIVTEMGLVGICVYISFIAAIFIINARTRRLLRRRKRGRELIYLSNGLDVALLGYIIAGQFITATYYPHLFQMSAWASALYIVALKYAGGDEENLPAETSIDGIRNG